MKITQVAINILKEVHNNPNRLSINKISVKIKSSTSYVNILVNKLVNEGYLIKNHYDKREIRLEITKRGKQIDQTIQKHD